ncbi:MAG TPA: hypothetical protein PKA74_15535 [Bauldia sp.]|nr:hypothetical protein [Bauldia sp.]
MLRTAILAAASIAALALPASASAPKPPMAHPLQYGAPAAHRSATGGQWYIIQSVASGACYVVDRRAGLDEAQVSGAYRSEGQADAALAFNIPCANAAGGNDGPEHQRNS